MPTLRQLNSLDHIEPQHWQQPTSQQDPFFNRFFLQALESERCVGAHNGWLPKHLSIENNGHTESFLPLYLKDHSEGEFVFDWNWANASQSAGIPYYPKLVSAIPFTPVTGPRLFEQSSDHAYALLNGIKQVAETTQASSWHLLFPDERTASTLIHAAQSHEEMTLLERRDCHFIWQNKNYSSFGNFLETFNSRKRKNIKKERRKVAEQGVTFEVIEGSNITAEHIHTFYPLYERTYLVRGRNPYLNAGFFLSILNSMPEHLILTLAHQNDRTVGAALFLANATSLYGRWWGGDPQIDCLHFETCYYQGIDIAINKGLSRFDPGIQGEHKLLRGFEPEQTRSLHWIREPRLASAVSEWLNHERRHIDQYQSAVRIHLPFRKNL